MTQEAMITKADLHALLQCSGRLRFEHRGRAVKRLFNMKKASATEKVGTRLGGRENIP